MVKCSEKAARKEIDYQEIISDQILFGSGQENQDYGRGDSLR
jgi:hypothetical protein